MLSAQLPAILIVIATALMAVVIFTPVHVSPPVAVSFAPPPRAVEFDDAAVPTFAPAFDAAPLPRDARWPERVDARAYACDVAARLALIDALAAVRGDWACGVLDAAFREDPDDGVRAAAATALDGARSHAVVEADGTSATRADGHAADRSV